MSEPITDQDLRDFAAGLRDDLEGVVLADDTYMDRLAEIWAEEDYGIDVRRPVVSAVKASRFVGQALGFAASTAARIASGLNALASGRTDRP